MQAEQVYKSFVEKAKYYLKELDYYGKAQFQMKPLKGEWSIGQLYDHLLNGTYTFHLAEVRNCLDRTGGSTGGKKKFKGKLVFKFKKLLFKVKGINQNGYVPAQPDNPRKVQDDLYRFLKFMNRTAKEIDSAPDLTYKTKHPDLGMLNALEWYMLIDFHFKHHLKLKKKLDPHVRSLTKELASEEY